MGQLPHGLPTSQQDTKWSSILNPLLANPSLQSVILQNVSLQMGLNTINHGLGRKLLGWRVVRLRATATIFDVQDTNSTPALTLILNSSAPVVVNLEVF
jgi:hypothetical protein